MLSLRTYGIILGLLLVSVIPAFSQTGYYRSVVAVSGDWNNITSWEYSVDNLAWGAIAAEGYPGELGVPTSVLVRDADEIIINVSPANSLGLLTVGEGVSGALRFGNDATIRSLSVNGALTIAVGATMNTNSNALHTLTANGNFVVNGAFSGFSSATQAINTTLTGTTGTISGAGTRTFNSLTVNRTGTTTVSAGFTIRNTFLINNTGTFDVGTQTISGAGATDTFQMTTGTFKIGGTNTFPGGFETVTLSGGTIWYGGLTQAVQHIESDGGVLVYNNITLSESAGGANWKTFSGNMDINGTITFEAAIDLNLGANSFSIGGSWIQNGTITTNFGTSTVTFDGGGFQQINNPINTNRIEFYNFRASGGGIVSIGLGSTTEVNADFIVTGNSTISSASTVFVRGNYSIAAGSVYNQTAGAISFDGTSAQAIDAKNSAFTYMYFDNGAPALKTITGDATVSVLFRVYDDATVTDAGVGQNHNLVGVNINGLVNFQGTINVSGSLYDTNDFAFNLGSADVVITGGSITANNAVTTSGNVTISSGTFQILAGASLTGTGKNFTINTLARMNIYANNGFPTGFASYSLAARSIVAYPLNGAQVVRGNLTYGELELGGGGVKTIDNPITVVNVIDLNNGVAVNAGAFTHILRDRIYNRTGSSFTSTGTVNIFCSDGANYSVLPTGTYTFNNLNIDTDTQTGQYIYDIDANITVNGNFTVSNNGGSALNVATFDIDDFIISNDFGDVFTVNQYVTLRTAGVATLQTSINSFASNTFNLLSTVYYNGTVGQTVTTAINPYGNLYLSGSGNKTASGSLNIDGDIRDVSGNYLFVLGGAANNHTIAGNATLSGINTTVGTSTITFDGANQMIKNDRGRAIIAFYHVIFAGTGTKTLDDNYDVNGNVTINAGVTVDASSNDVDFYLARNWVNNGTFTQTSGEFYIDGTSGNQTMFNAAGSSFGEIYIQKPSGAQRFTLTSDLVISRGLRINAANEFVTSTYSVYVGGFFYMEATSIWTQLAASTLYLNGTGLQDMNLYEPAVFTNIVFRNSGTKRNIGGVGRFPIDVDGNLSIEAGSTFNSGGHSITVAKTWTNDGSFLQTGTVIFDGTNQTINPSSFNRIQLSTSGTKTLGGGITVSDDIIIDVGVTLDVSASNHPITIGDDLTVAGTLNARSGNITFNGANGVLTTGGTTFYNLNFNKNIGARMDLVGDLDVNGDLKINSGTLEMDTYDFRIAGSLLVDIGAILSVNSASSDIIFDATSGSHTIQTSGSPLRTVTINAPGATYKLADDLTLTSTYPFTLTAGTFSLNSKKMTLQGVGGLVTINGGTFDVNENAVLEIPNNQSISNNGGVFKVVGLAGNPARVQRQGAVGGYTINQTAGTFHALYYEFYNTITTGITISGGAIDATNNFSKGAFVSGTGSQYLDITGIAIAAIVADNISFGTGPTNNVTRTSGVGSITFEDATGNLAGEAFDNDPLNLIDWTFPGGIYWDGGGLDSKWSTDLNWSGNTKPTSINNVILNHRDLAGAYAVIVDEDAFANRVTLEDGPSGAIGLTISSGFDLTITANMIIGASTSVEINDALSVLSIGESFENAGTFTHTNGAVRFDGTTGSHTINTGGSPFNDLVIDANGATYTLAGALTINDDITLLDGTLDVSTNNYAITVGGDWSNIGLTTFNSRSGTVTLNLGGTSTQLVAGGPFYNLTTENGTGIGTATKQLSANVAVNYTVVIGLNTVLDAQTNNLYVGRNWTNNASVTGFNQSGPGTVTFNGAGTQTIDNGTFITTFNHLGISGGGTVNLANNSNVNGNVALSTGVFNLSTFTLNGVGGANIFDVAGTSTVYLYANNFPSTFETVTLASNSTIQYRGNISQDVYNTTYGNLLLLRSNAGNLQTKTALGDIVVLGNLTVNDVDTEFNLDGHKLTLTGNLAFPTAGRPIVWNSGIVELNGIVGFAFDADITEWPNLILSGVGNKSLAGNINVTGDVVVQNGVNFRLLANTITATGGVQSFNVDNGASLDIRIPTATGVAFPTNFDTYGLGVNSTVSLNSVDPMTLFSGVSYGNLTFANTTIPYGTVTLDGNLDVDGDFNSYRTTLVDAGFDLAFSGADIQLNNYTASATSTLNLNGTSQTLRDTFTNTFSLNNVIFSGSGIKTLQDGNDDYDINGNITINSGVTVATTRPYTFSGASFTNNGTFTHTANTFTFDRAGAQTIAINPINTATDFNSITFTNGGAKTFTTYGANISNVITVDAGTTLNLGAFDYTLAYNGANFITTGTLISSAANITLTGPNPYIPASFAVNNLYINTTSYTRLSGNLDVNGNLEISPISTLTVNNAAYTINLGGNFINNNVFNDSNAGITFDGSVAAVTITTNGATFYNATFSPTVPAVYTLTSPTNLIERALTVNANATLDLNSTQLTLGSNIAAGKTATINGTLLIDDSAILIFDNSNTGYTMNVGGTLSVVGTGSNNATITSIGFANTRRTALTIGASGKIAARYYLIEYLNENGLVLTNGSTVDATNNFSDGAWANLITAAGGPYYYMTTNNVAIAGTISNVSFGFSTTPTPGVHYNLRRGAGASVITFGGSISGPLGGAAYENDPGSKINWPILASSTWTGTYDTDWNQAANWSALSVPIASTDVTIPLVANNPKITTADAVCKDITISNGALTMENGYDITIAGNLTIGTGTNAGALVVSHVTSEIFIAGNWLRGTNGIFSNGSSTVTFNATSGTVSTTPLLSPFYNVVINGPATFLFTGSAIDINGNLTITQGTFSPSTNNYNITLAGNLNNSGGIMDYATNGTYTLDGAAQVITAANFDKLTVSGTLTKTFNGAIIINDNLIVNSTLETALGCVLDINLGTVSIAASGIFNNSGGGTHTVSSTSWSSSGTYLGTGIIKFDGGNQTVNASSFAAVEFAGTGVKYLGGNLTLTGDLMLRAGFSRLELGTYTITQSGGATMTLEGNQSIYLSGANNFPSGFGTYNLDYTSIVNYRSTSPQTIRGDISYGNLSLASANTKTLGGNIIVQKTLTFNDATLDVSINNYSINIGDDWNNNSTGSFIARLGEVVFDGSDPANVQYIRSSLTGTKEFYKISVNKTDGTVQAYDENLVIKDNLSISQGNFTAGGLTVTIGGSFDNSGGTFAQSGTYLFNSTSGSEIIRGGGSLFSYLTIDAPGTSYVCQDNVSIYSNFILTRGTFDGNGKAISIGNNAADIITVDGTYIVGANGLLKLGSGVNFTINSGGTIYVVGTAGNPATVTRAAAGSYAFQVNGTIHAKNYVFEYMDANGIVINSSATINAANNFSNGTFTSGVSGGSFLRIENTQSLTLDAVNFPTNPGGAASNITKVVAASGTLTMTNATGAFAGEAFDDDPNNLINWPTPIVLTWVGGTSSDWFTASNWSASSGPNIVPTGAENVIIATGTNQPIINTSGALANNLTINSSSTLTMNTVNEAGDDLKINSNLTLNGGLIVSSANDSILIAGSWLKGAAGTFSHGSSTVIFNNTAGSHTINNGTVAFYNVVVNATASYALAANTTISNNLSIVSGTFDVSASNYSLSVGNKWNNTGTFNPRAGTVTLTKSTAGTVNLNNGASAFYHLNINGGAATVFAISSNSLQVNGNLSITASKLDLNSLNLIFGDGTGADVLNISGTLAVGANSQLRLGANATVQVQSGGVFKAVGSDASNIATVTRNTTGAYTFLVSSGATIQARYYSMGYMDSNGIQVQSGATIAGTPLNFSDGTFTNGAPGGRYLSVLGITTNHTIRNVVFNSGPTKNVRGSSGSGNYLTFEDASGLLAGTSYEDDDNVATTGAIRWTSTSTQYTWTGAVSTDWNVLGNWNDGIGIPVALPDATVDVIIPNVANDPIISVANAAANNVTIQVAGSLVINTNRSLTIASNFTNGGSLTIANGSTSTLSIGNTYSNAGTVTFGNASTVELTASSGIKSLAFGASALNNLTLNGAATFNLTSNLDVNGNLTIAAGTLDVTASNYSITVAGNWINSSGTFTARSGRVTFDGTGAQSIQAGGSAASKRFYNFRIAKSNTATLTSDIYVSNNVELNSGTFALSSYTMEVIGLWTNTNVTVTPGTSTTIFSGSSSIALTSKSQSFNHFIVNKTGGNQVSLSSNTGIEGTLTITSGTLLLNGRRLDYGDGADNMSISGTMYVDAGSTLGMHQNSSATVNNGGTLRITGTNAATVATVTRRAATAGWNMVINGTLKTRYAVFEYSGGNGITIGATGLLDVTDNLSNTTFRNGTGTSYLTLAAPITTTIEEIVFNTGPTKNVTATSGAYTFNNYSGSLAGARYESDGGLHPGYAKWKYNKSQNIVGLGTYNYGNEVLINVTANAGITAITCDYRDALYGTNFNMLPRYFRLLYTGTTATGNLTFAYADNELGTMTEANLKVWVHKGGLKWVNLGGTLDMVNNTLVVNGYSLGEGTAAETINKVAGDNSMPILFDGSEDFVISDAPDQASLPVELSRFEVKPMNKVGNVQLEWETKTETENYGFTVYKSYLGPVNVDEPNKSVPFDTTWTELVFVEGKGNSTEATVYMINDDQVEESGRYVYRLSQTDFDGKTSSFAPIEFLYTGPQQFDLKQNYPNPFNPITIIPYDVAKRTHVRVELFNAIGQRVQVLVNEVRNPGTYRIEFNATKLSSGMYIVRYVADGKSFVKKMMFVK